MSQWTHVVGSMSLDYMLATLGGADPVADLKAIVGKWENEWLSHDSSGIEYSKDSLENHKTYGSGPEMPSGSEGPLFFVVNRIGSKSSMNNAMITIWGNLRDFGQAQVDKELIPYFQDLVKRLKESHCGVRNMAVEIEVEFGKRFVLTAGEEYTVKVTEVIKEVSDATA